MNDNIEDASKTAKWIIDNLGPNIPLHLVAYHPAFRYTKKRTSIETLLALRNVVVEHGIEYCYLGNIYADDVSNTKCKSCNETLVKRFGLSIEVNNISPAPLFSISCAHSTTSFFVSSLPLSVRA